MTATAATLLSATAFFAMFFLLTLYMQGVLGWSPLKTGLAYLPYGLLIIVGGGLASALVPRLGARVLLAAGCGIGAVGPFMLSMISADGTYVGDALPGSLVLGFGAGLTFPTLGSASVHQVSEENAGPASGVQTAMSQVGGARARRASHRRADPSRRPDRCRRDAQAATAFQLPLIGPDDIDQMRVAVKETPASGNCSAGRSQNRETAMYNPDQGFPRVVPELVYRDVAAAVDWLAKVFGFREILRHTLDNGQVGHADMDTGGGGVIMLSAARGELNSPADDGHVCKKLIVFVDDVDRHFAAVEEAGVETVHRPVDKPWGLRQFLVKDLEGHMWEFTKHVRDVPAQDWGAEVR